MGVETFRSNPLGLADTQQQQRYHNHFQRKVREFLRPEMFNRIDRILASDPLESETVSQIARLRIDEVQRRNEDDVVSVLRGITLLRRTDRLGSQLFASIQNDRYCDASKAKRDRALADRFVVIPTEAKSSPRLHNIC